jgi:hypothetical protein
VAVAASTVVEVAAAVVAVADTGKFYGFNEKGPTASAGGLFSFAPRASCKIPSSCVRARL